MANLIPGSMKLPNLELHTRYGEYFKLLDRSTDLFDKIVLALQQGQTKDNVTFPHSLVQS